MWRSALKRARLTFDVSFPRCAAHLWRVWGLIHIDYRRLSAGSCTFILHSLKSSVLGTKGQRGKIAEESGDG